MNSVRKKIVACSVDPVRPSERGQSMLEVAFFFTILTILLVGVVQVGVAINAYLVIINATREGARYAVSDFNRTNAEVAGLTRTTASNLSLSNSNATIVVTRVQTNTVSTVSVTSYVLCYLDLSQVTSTCSTTPVGSDTTRFTQAEITTRLNVPATKVPGDDEFVIVEFIYRYPFFLSPVNIPMYTYAIFRVVGN